MNGSKNNKLKKIIRADQFNPLDPRAIKHTIKDQQSLFANLKSEINNIYPATSLPPIASITDNS